MEYLIAKTIDPDSSMRPSIESQEKTKTYQGGLKIQLNESDYEELDSYMEKNQEAIQNLIKAIKPFDSRRMNFIFESNRLFFVYRGKILAAIGETKLEEQSHYDLAIEVHTSLSEVIRSSFHWGSIGNSLSSIRERIKDLDKKSVR